jgi:hypothetical protein
MEHKKLWLTLKNAPKWAWAKALGFGCIFLLIQLLFLSAGFAIWMIAYGIYLILSRLVIYWKPARKLVMGLLNFKSEEYLVMPVMTWQRYLFLAPYFIAAIGLIYFGFTTLLYRGFLDQNIIYLMINGK